MIKSQFLYILLLSFFSGFMKAQITESNYLMYDVRTGNISSLNQLAERMNEYDVMLFGEEHNDSVTHYIQHKLLEILNQKYSGNVCLSMEMFDRDVQSVVDEYLMDKIKERHFKKDARVWNNYSDYKPLIEYCKSKKIPVIAANAASRYTNLAGREGMQGLKSLPKNSWTHFAPIPYDTASGRYLEKFNGIMGHVPLSTAIDSTTKNVTIPAVSTFKIMLAQSLWDATMAYSISEHWKKNKKQKIYHLNGRFHSDEKLGIYTHLQKYAPKAKVLVVSCFSADEFPTIDSSKYDQLGDFIIITDPQIPKTFE